MQACSQATGPSDSVAVTDNLDIFGILKKVGGGSKNSVRLRLESLKRKNSETPREGLRFDLHMGLRTILRPFAVHLH